MRQDGRQVNELRTIKVIPDFLKHSFSSVLIEWGNTRVLCSTTVTEEIPQWMKNEKKKGGWITGEYQLLPTSTQDRVRRERNGLSGRTQEIQRLIGRSLRGACNLEKLDGLTIYIDCDVIDADGGTRCASITGSMIALKKALGKLIKTGRIEPSAYIQDVAAVSVGIVNGAPMLDLCYLEDKTAEVDMNVVMSDDSKIIEIQGTAEGKSFTRSDLDSMLELAETGLNEIFQIQKQY